jgi:acetyl-CoA carboxylase biotin carboxylase subunit
VYAEDPDAGFMPSPGHITHVRAPAGPGVRDDSGVVSGSDIPIFYDSLVSKVATWGADRGAALARMARAMAEYEIRGVRTTIPFYRWILQDVDFGAGRFDTTSVDRLLEPQRGRSRVTVPVEADTVAAIAVTLHALDGKGTLRAGLSLPPDAWTQRAREEALRHWPVA